jgi:hypothetical protein
MSTADDDSSSSSVIQDPISSSSTPFVSRSTSYTVYQPVGCSFSRRALAGVSPKAGRNEAFVADNFRCQNRRRRARVELLHRCQQRIGLVEFAAPRRHWPVSAGLESHGNRPTRASCDFWTSDAFAAQIGSGGAFESWKEKPTYLVQYTTLTATHQLERAPPFAQGYGGKGNSTQFIEVFDPKSNKALRNITPPGFKPSNGDLFAFSPTGAPRLLVGEYPRQFSFQFSLWEPRAGRRFWQQTVPGLNPQIEWTPDARFLIATQVTGSHGRDLFPLHDTLVFDARTGQKVRSLPTQSTVYAATISGDVLVTYGTQHRPDKKQHWTSLQFTNWRNGRKILHRWMPGGMGLMREIAASPTNGTVFGNRDGLIMWRTADLKRDKNQSKTVHPAVKEAETFTP